MKVKINRVRLWVGVCVQTYLQFDKQKTGDQLSEHTLVLGMELHEETRIVHRNKYNPEVGMPKERVSMEGVVSSFEN